MKYELFYLIGASQEADLEKIKNDVEKIITENEGAFEGIKVEEKKRLAYKIKHEAYGHFIAQRFSIEPEKLSEINKKLNLYTGVLRFMLSKAEDLPELKIRERESEKEKKFPVAPEKNRDRKEFTPKQPQISSNEVKKEEKITAEEAKKTEEDIDKKLEEILNI